MEDILAAELDARHAKADEVVLHELREAVATHQDGDISPLQRAIAEAGLATLSHLHEPDDFRGCGPRGHGLRLRFLHFTAAHDPHSEMREGTTLLCKRLTPL